METIDDSNYFSPQYDQSTKTQNIIQTFIQNSPLTHFKQILDTNQPLHFRLRRLQLIEMIRTYLSNPTKENTERALEFANQDLAPFAPTNPEFLLGLQQAMGLFILTPASTTTSTSTTQTPAHPLSQLLEPAQRRIVAEEVNQAILESQGSRREARLYQLVKTRQWAEKQAREKKIDLPPKLDMGLDGDLSTAENGSNGHANGNGEDSVMGEGSNEAEAGGGDDEQPRAAGLRRLPNE